MLDIKTYTWQTKTQPAYLGIEVLGGGGGKEGIELHEYCRI